jgi:hypothetical protein
VSDYIKRLEECLRRRAGSGSNLVSVNIEDLRSLLSDVERMRGALEKSAEIFDWILGMTTDGPTGNMAASGADQARQALSAPNTGGTHD